MKTMKTRVAARIADSGNQTSAVAMVNDSRRRQQGDEQGQRTMGDARGRPSSMQTVTLAGPWQCGCALLTVLQQLPAKAQAQLLLSHTPPTTAYCSRTTASITHSTTAGAAPSAYRSSCR
jgi:hypothetical protein